MPKASGSGKKGGLLSREQQYELHNPNSALRVIETREDKRLHKINALKKLGFSDRELKEEYLVPLRKRQDPPVGPLNEGACVLISAWASKRIDFLYLMFFGNGSSQATGDMVAITDHIQDVIRPQLDAIYAEIRTLEGDPVMPPKFFLTPLKEYQLPTSPSKGKGKSSK